MEKKQVVCEYKIYDSIIELPEEYRQVLEAAISAADSSYSPYSGFSVGAAIKLGNGVIVKGSNQEYVLKELQCSTPLQRILVFPC